MRKIMLLVLLLILAGILVFVLTKKQAEAPTEIADSNTTQNSMKFTSPAFQNEGFIPSKYTCNEVNINPPLEIAGVPKEAKSLVLIMDDPDVPKALRPDGVFDHWVLYDIPTTTVFFDEGGVAGTAGVNGRGEAKYTGPCPPTQYQPTTHRYFFKLYALDFERMPSFETPPSKATLQGLMKGHIIAEVTLMGKYDKLKTIREND